jgi:transposase InsO family protein
MAYTTNPKMPRLRMQAVDLLRQGWSVRQVSRYTGFSIGAISKWSKKAPDDARMVIPTVSSRPHSCPHATSAAVEDRIAALRLKHRRCAEVVQHLLRQENIHVSLRTVKRVLKRRGLIKERSKHRKIRISPKRPIAAVAGDLVQLDTIHIHTFDGRRFYIYTLLDVHSRWAWAKVSMRITAGRTVRFLREAQEHAPFSFKMLQTDHGTEFSRHFTKYAKTAHRFSRVRRPNDNAHLERFNRTIQEECLYYLKQEPRVYQAAIRRYLPFYNNERPHLGLDLKSPSKCFQATA